MNAFETRTNETRTDDARAESLIDVARRYGRAKSRQDIDAALACCTEDFVLDTLPFGMHATGRQEVAWDLGVFFEMFPDYEFVTAGSSVSEGVVVLRGYARMTWTGRLPAAAGIPLSGLARMGRRQIEVPAVAILETRDGLLSREQFLFDMAAFSRQLGLPAWVVRGVLRRVERRRLAAVRGRYTIREENSLIVRAPIEDVFARMHADVRELVRANPPKPFLHALEIELVGADAMRAGAIRRVHLSNGHVANERIEECTPPFRLRYRVENGFGFPISPFVSCAYGTHELEPLADGRTRVTWRGFAEPRHFVTRPIADLLRATVLGPMQRRFLRSIAKVYDTEAVN